MFPGFTFLGKFLSSYALICLAAVFIVVPLSIRWFKKRGGDDISMIFVYLFSAIGVFLGMHLLYGITNIQYWGLLMSFTSFDEFISAATTIFGGGVFYGGLLGGLVAGGISVKVQKLPADVVSDCVAPSIALFHCFGRIGCFLSGCCYGIESEHGITFTHSVVESANGVPRVPVQLYEAAFELLLFFVLWFMLSRNFCKGKLLLVYLFTYAVGRFILEFWRGDTYRGFLFGLSTSQIISILVFAVSVILFIFRPIGNKNKEQMKSEDIND